MANLTTPVKRQIIALRKAGISAMPPHVTYVLTDKGFEELQVADALGQQSKA